MGHLSVRAPRWQSRLLNEFIEQKPLANCARISYYSLSRMKGVVALLVGMSVSAVVAIAFGFIAGHLTAVIAAASLLCGAGGAMENRFFKRIICARAF